jgi:hypothetical protein
MMESWAAYCRRELTDSGPFRLIKETLLATLAEIPWIPTHPLEYYPAHCRYLALPADGRLRAKSERDRDAYLQAAQHRWQAIVPFMDRFHLIEAGGSRHPNRLKGKRCPLRGGRGQWHYDWGVRLFCYDVLNLRFSGLLWGKVMPSAFFSRDDLQWWSRRGHL